MIDTRHAARPLATYFVLVAAWVVLGRVLGWLHLGEALSFALAKLALPLALTALVVTAARRQGNPGDLLSLRRPAFRPLIFAAVSGIPPLLILLLHCVSQGFLPLLSHKAALLTLRIAVNQGWLEEVLARGLLLGSLVALRLRPRAAIVWSAVGFAFGHILQFLVPPISVEGILNGLAYVVLTLPDGIVLGALTLRARSLWPAVLAHFLGDLLILPQNLMKPSMGLILLGALAQTALLALLLWLEARGQRGEYPRARLSYPRARNSA